MAAPLLATLYAALALGGGLPFEPMVLLASAVLAAALIWLSLTDLDRFIIPDTANLGLCILGLAITALLDRDAIMAHLIAGLMIGGALWAISEAYLRLRRVDGLGLGDAKLMTAVGFWLGWQDALAVLLFAALTGLSIAILVHLRHRPTEAMPLPFGPFIALSFWIVWLYGSPL